MQRSHFIYIFHIGIYTSRQVLFDGFDVSVIGSLVNIHTWPTPHQHHGYDCCE